MTQSMSTEDSFEFSMTQNPSQSQSLIQIKNLSSRRDTKIRGGFTKHLRLGKNIIQINREGLTFKACSLGPAQSNKFLATQENLLEIHKKIRLHLRKEKLLNKFEMRKMLANLNRMTCQSPRIENIVELAKNILDKCIHSHSQSSEKEAKKVKPRKAKLTLNSMTTPHSQTSKLYNETETQTPSVIMELDNSSLDATNTMELGIFENKLNNSKATLEEPGFTQSASNMFPHQTPNLTETSSVAKESIRCEEINHALSNVDNLEFTVPTPLEKNNQYYSSAFQGSNVIKLKLNDVQLDSESVSIPLELLTNLNFDESSEKKGSSNCLVKTPDNGNTGFQHPNFQTVPSCGTTQYDKINTINIPSSLLSNNYYPHFNNSSNNIEVISTQNNLPPTNELNIISDVTTFGTQKEILTISQLPTNSATRKSELNIEVDNSSPKDSSDIIVINIDSSTSEATNNANVDLNSDMPHNGCLAPVKNLDNSTGCVDQKEILKVSDNEKRYLDMIADDDNTDDILFNTNKNSNIVLYETSIDETQEDNHSFVFDLGTESADVIEGTPFDKERKKMFHHKIQTQFYKNQHSQGANDDKHKIPVISKINTIDETPSNDTSETPELSAALESSSPSEEVPYSDQNPINKKRKLKQSFETQMPSASILSPFEGAYFNPPVMKISTSSKIGLIENNTIEDTGVVHSQSVSDFSLKDMEMDPSSSNAQDMDQTTNMILINGSIQKNTEPMSISREENESFEEKDRKLYEQIKQKRNKYKEKWTERPISERVSLKYINKFGINIFEDPPELLRDLNCDVPVNKFNFGRFTLKEMAEKQKEWFRYQSILNECAEKMVNMQISLNNHDGHHLTTNHVEPLDSDSSDEEQIVLKKLIHEITVLPMMNFEKSMENCAEEKKDENKENRQKKMSMEIIEQDSKEEINNLNENREKKSLESMLRIKELNWLK